MFLLEGFCTIWIAEGGEPIGRALGDNEAIDTLTGLLAHGLTGSRRQPHDGAGAVLSDETDRALGPGRPGLALYSTATARENLLLFAAQFAAASGTGQRI